MNDVWTGLRNGFTDIRAQLALHVSLWRLVVLRILAAFPIADIHVRFPSQRSFSVASFTVLRSSFTIFFYLHEISVAPLFLT